MVRVPSVVKSSICLVVVLFLVGCATTHSLEKLSVDMSNNDVIKTIGRPKTTRKSIKNKSKEPIEIWEYPLNTPMQLFEKIALAPFTLGMSFSVSTQIYCLYFLNNKLMDWGKTDELARRVDLNV